MKRLRQCPKSLLFPQTFWFFPFIKQQKPEIFSPGIKSKQETRSTDQ